MCVAQSDYWLVLAAACKMSAWVREQARLRVWNDAQPRLLADCVGGGYGFCVVIRNCLANRDPASLASQAVLAGSDTLLHSLLKADRILSPQLCSIHVRWRLVVWIRKH